MSALSIDAARDAAQQMVTAVLHDDRDTAVEVAQEFPDALVLALVLTDFAAYVHHRWSDATGIDRSQAWRELMTDIAEWRESA